MRTRFYPYLIVVMILMALPLLVMACGEPEIKGASPPEGAAEGHGGGHGEEEAHGPTFEESYTLEMGTEPVVVHYPEGWAHAEIEAILPGAAEGALEIANYSELVDQEATPTLSSGDLLMQFQIIVGEGLDTETLPNLLNAMRSLSVGDFTSSYVVEYPRLRDLGTHSAATAWYEGTLGDGQAAEAVQITMMLSETDLLVINAVFPPREYNDHRAEIFDIASAVQVGEGEGHGEEEHAEEEEAADEDEDGEAVGAVEGEDLPDAEATLSAAAAEADATAAAQATASAEASEIARQATATAVSVALGATNTATYLGQAGLATYTIESPSVSYSFVYPENWIVREQVNQQSGETVALIGTNEDVFEVAPEELTSEEVLMVIETLLRNPNQPEGFDENFPLELLESLVLQVSEDMITQEATATEISGYPAATMIILVSEAQQPPAQGSDAPTPIAERVFVVLRVNENQLIAISSTTPVGEAQVSLPTIMDIAESIEVAE